MSLEVFTSRYPEDDFYDEDGNLLGIEVYAGVIERMDLSHLVTKGFSFGEVRREE